MSKQTRRRVLAEVLFFTEWPDYPVGLYAVSKY